MCRAWASSTPRATTRGPRSSAGSGAGRAGARLVTSDAHEGLRCAVEETFQGAAWQRRAVHLMCDCAGAASGSRRTSRRVSRIVAPVFRLREGVAVRAAYHLAIEMLEGCCPEAARILEEAEPDAMAYLDFPPSHWKRLCTNSLQERTIGEIKRRLRVVQVFPSVASLERLAGTVMCDQDEEWSRSRYFSQRSMSELPDEPGARQTAAISRSAASIISCRSSFPLFTSTILLTRIVLS